MAEKILVIDDDIVNLKIAEHVLEKDYTVVCAKSGFEGIDILKSDNIDLVLLDLYMPDMSGMDVLTKIREDESISGVKVVILTSSGMKTDVTEAIRLGALDFIKKPFFPNEFLERIKRVLQIAKKDNILVVDDDKMNLAIVQKMLGIRYDVACVSSGREAIAYLNTNIPSMILLDLHMPEMNGLEVLEKIREQDNLADIPVVFLTADNDRKTEIDIFKAGAMDFIQKPFVAEVVIQRISRILELYHYQKSLKREVDKKTEELRESNRRVTNVLSQMIMALGSAIDAKDVYTNGHSERVAKYSGEIARRMGKSTQEINDIYYIGLLHDIGKIGIPDYIINKAGKLTEEEYELIKNHPNIGAEILSSITEMPGISFGAHWHHERFDGKGYPDGLAGEDIPEVARIICVADAYDTMTSKRVYRDVLPQKVARDEILKGRGTQFDPVIADYMLEMIDEDTDYQLHE